MKGKKFRTHDLAYIAMCSALICICTWISIPSVVPFTLQTFAVFASVELLGGKRGALSVLLYILLGAVGLPVFSGFNGGIGVLFGTTGGYIVGFLFICLIYYLAERFFGASKYVRIAAMLVGLIVCYAFGTAWFVYMYTANKGAITVASALSMCVLPFVLPDLIKMLLAMLLAGRVKKYIIK